MKKLFTILVIGLFALLGAERLSAQVNYGVIGGATFSTTSIKEINKGTMTQYHAGATLRVKLPVGFSIQPSLLYQVKGATMDLSMFEGDMTISFVELPISLQWGPDLLLFRPFLDVTPFVGYALSNKFKTEGLVIKNDWDDINRWEYGVGVGVGLDIWKFQVIARYNWNLGSLSKPDTNMNFGEFASQNLTFGGFTLSAAFLF